MSGRRGRTGLPAAVAVLVVLATVAAGVVLHLGRDTGPTAFESAASRPPACVDPGRRITRPLPTDPVRGITWEALSECPDDPSTIVRLGRGDCPAGTTGMRVVTDRAVWTDAVSAWKAAHGY